MIASQKHRVCGINITRTKISINLSKTMTQRPHTILTQHQWTRRKGVQGANSEFPLLFSLSVQATSLEFPSVLLPPSYWLLREAASRRQVNGISSPKDPPVTSCCTILSLSFPQTNLRPMGCKMPKWPRQNAQLFLYLPRGSSATMQHVNINRIIPNS